jgi:hypothetical protein
MYDELRNRRNTGWIMRFADCAYCSDHWSFFELLIAVPLRVPIDGSFYYHLPDLYLRMLAILC